MISRLRKSFTYLKKHPFKIIGLTSTLVAYKAYSHLTQKDEKLNAAYEKFRERVKLRSSHLSIHDKFLENCKTRIYPAQPIKTHQSSAEISVQLDASVLGSPMIPHDDGSYSMLDALSSASWRDFLSESSDEICISFGHRKAFSATNPVQFTHAVIYVSDTEGHHALYGYSSNKNNFLINDANNKTVSRHYTLYPDLTIKGSKQQVQKLLERIEHFSLQRYTFIGCNCYSPLISGLLEAKKIGFTVPNDFNDSLLIVIPSEQNYGMGITSNHYLKPLSDSAVLRTQLFFEKLKAKASQKFDEVQEVASQKLDEAKANASKKLDDIFDKMKKKP